MVNKMIQVDVKVGNTSTPPIRVDLSKDDKAEDAIGKAVHVIDLDDAIPHNGKLDVKTVVKIAGGLIRIPVTLSISEVPAEVTTV